MLVDKTSWIEVTAWAWVPPLARGSAQPENYRAEQPFGQVPVYKEGALCLFEPGAIVLHIGAKDERLLPHDEPARSRAIAWMFAAPDSIEPQTFTLAAATIFFGDAPWSAGARAAVTPLVVQRLARLSGAPGDKDWLEGRFAISDLMMVDVLRAIPGQALVAAHPNLASYVARGTARPAFKRAMAAQLTDFISDQAPA